MAEKKTDTKSADAKTTKKPGKMLIVVVAAVALVGTLVGVKQVGAKGQTHVKVAVKGPIMPLDEFLVNLADPGGDHFLKVNISVELNPDKGKTAETMKEQIAPMRDAILMSLTSKHRDDLTTPAGREKLKGEIKQKVNVALGEDDVQAIYFTNFVTQ